jgi:hypothetical protein
VKDIIFENVDSDRIAWTSIYDFFDFRTLDQLIKRIEDSVAVSVTDNSDLDDRTDTVLSDGNRQLVWTEASSAPEDRGHLIFEIVSGRVSGGTVSEHQNPSFVAKMQSEV